MLARWPIGLRLRHGPTALGNAVGEGLAGVANGMGTSGMPSEGPVPPVTDQPIVASGLPVDLNSLLPAPVNAASDDSAEPMPSGSIDSILRREGVNDGSPYYWGKVSGNVTRTEGGDTAQMGEFKLLNGVPDLDNVSGSKWYKLPISGAYDSAAADAAYQAQAQTWQGEAGNELDRFGTLARMNQLASGGSTVGSGTSPMTNVTEPLIAAPLGHWEAVPQIDIAGGGVTGGEDRVWVSDHAAPDPIGADVAAAFADPVEGAKGLAKAWIVKPLLDQAGAPPVLAPYLYSTDPELKPDYSGFPGNQYSNQAQVGGAIVGTAAMVALPEMWSSLRGATALETALDLGTTGEAATGAGSRALGAEVDTIPRTGTRLVLDQSYVSDIGDVACGPTACAMVINDRGQWVNISHIAQDAGLVPGIGTDVNGLADALQTNGVGTARAVFGATIDDLAAATANGDAAIAHVNLSGDTGHFVVVDGVTNRGGQAVVAVRDPLDGQFFVPVDQFNAKFSGQAVLTNGPY